MLLMSDSLKDRINLEDVQEENLDEILCWTSTKSKSIICRFIEAKVSRTGEVAELSVEVSAEAAAYILHNSPITGLVLNSPQNKNHLLEYRESGYDIIIKRNELTYVMIIHT
jgi:hypothetical protein